MWLTTIDRQLFSPVLYKKALAQEHVYYQLPGILTGILTSSTPLNSCAGNPLACLNISPELKACYQQALGMTRYNILSNGTDHASAAEQALIVSCLKQYGPGDTQGPFGTPGFLKNLQAKNWEAIINLALPPQELQSMLEGGLDQTFAYLKGQTDSAGIPLVKFKQQLLGQSSAQILMIILHSQPACTTDELEKIILGLSKGEILICNPVDDQTLGLILPILQGPMNSLIGKIPDKLVLIGPLPAGSPVPGQGPFGSDPITTMRLARQGMELSPVLPLAFLLLITGFGVRSVKSWLQWWGIPILIAGLLALGLAGMSMLGIDWGWNTFIATRIPSYLPSAISEIGHGLVTIVMGSLANSVVLQAFILSLVGLLALGGSFYVKNQP